MSDFPRHLWHALWDAGLLSVPALQSRCQTAVRERNEAERDFLVTRIGEMAWQRVLAAWDKPETERQAMSHLGFGAVMAEFFAAPAPYPDTAQAAVGHLGALVNLLGRIYDDIIDAGTVSDPLPRRALQALSLGQTVPQEEAPPLVALAGEYFRQLAALAGTDAHPQVLRTLRRAILTMHTAERATVIGDGAAARMAAWRHKTVLPFVVMALPAWLTVSSVSASAYYRHLRWLYRSGEFWGWLDDAMDLAEDAAAGHANYVAEALTQQTPPAVAARIAGRGRTVLADWRRITPSAADLPLVVQEAIPTIIFSTVSHALSQTRKEVNT